MSRTLVTGGTGFLGKRLVERLLGQGREVLVLARRPLAELEGKGVRFAAVSLDDAEAVKAACQGVDTVFHVAAKVGVWGRYDDFYRTNVLGTKALLDGCVACDVKRFVYTSTPSVVYNGLDLADADESLPLTTECPSPYPLTKAIAEKAVLEANSDAMKTVALRPHLIWGVGDPHLVPRILEKARAGKLRIVGKGENRVDMVHVDNAVDAHLLAEAALGKSNPIGYSPSETAAKTTGNTSAAGKAYFITNDEPILMWKWVNELLASLGIDPIERHVPLPVASAAGALCEAAWKVLPLKGEPPMTRFVAAELAKDHWFDISAAKRDLGYKPRISMAEGTVQLLHHLKEQSA